MARLLVAQIGQGVAPGIGVLVTGGDDGSGLLAVPVHPPARVVPFPARLHVLLVLVPGGDSPEEVLALLQGLGEVLPVPLAHGAHSREHQEEALVGAGGLHSQISRALQAGGPVHALLENPPVSRWVLLAPVADVVVADAVDVGKPASLDGGVQNPLHSRMPVDRRLQVALVIPQVSLVENQMRSLPPDQFQDTVGSGAVSRVPDEGHLEIGCRNHQTPLRVFL